MSDYQAVLFLVAMDTGTPDIAPAFFRVLLQSGDQENPNNSGSSPVHNLDWLLHQLKMVEDSLEKQVQPEGKPTSPSDPSIPKQTDRDRLEAWLKSSKARQIMGNDISSLFEWAERVVRYSFHGGFERS